MLLLDWENGSLGYWVGRWDGEKWKSTELVFGSNSLTIDLILTIGDSSCLALCYLEIVQFW